MAVRHIYLKIETIPDYTPVNPDPTAGPPIHYGRDCMRNMGLYEMLIFLPIDF